MYNVYLYLPETLADWEVGHITAELRSKRFFRADAPQVTLRTVGLTAESVLTMGGLRVVPDGTIDEIPITSETVLLLPGANTWNDPTHGTAVALAARLLGAGGTVCAICGATVALANAGLLDQRPHTSNGAGFLDAFCPSYKGSPSSWTRRPFQTAA